MSVGRQNLYYRISLSGTFMTCEDLRRGSDIVITLPEESSRPKNSGKVRGKYIPKKSVVLNSSSGLKLFDHSINNSIKKYVNK